MSDCSIHPNTPEKWIVSMQDSLARTLALLESKQELVREPDQVFTVKYCELRALFDPDTYSWRTWPLLPRKVLTKFSKTWPRWGMTQDGVAYAHPMSEHRITETGGGYLPTPTVTSGAQVAWDKTPGQTGGTTLAGYVKYWPTPDCRGFVNEGSLQMLAKVCNSEQEFRAMAYRASTSRKTKYWPTPTAHNAKETNAPSEANRNEPTLASQAGGKLNPTWVEWLMAFPIGFTASRDWVTRSVQSKRRSRGSCSEGNDANP